MREASHKDSAEECLKFKGVTDFIGQVINDGNEWNEKDKGARPWFRGESDKKGESRCPLLPKVADYTAQEENYLLQSFRRKAGGLAKSPPRENTDQWLFLAQHYGVPTRLLDWTDGALFALYFAINEISANRTNPTVYMLNPHRLNEAAFNCSIPDCLSHPLTWHGHGTENIRHAWQERDASVGCDLPVAVAATFQDFRMLSQRSCFTVHGKRLAPLRDLLQNCKNLRHPLSEYIKEYHFDEIYVDSMLDGLSLLGVSSSSIFPDLDHLGTDLKRDVDMFRNRLSRPKSSDP